MAKDTKTSTSHSEGKICSVLAERKRVKITAEDRRKDTRPLLFCFCFFFVSQNRKRHRLDNDGKWVASYRYLDRVKGEKKRSLTDLLPEGNSRK